MTRPAAFGFLSALAIASPIIAEPPAKDVSVAHAVQRAMGAAREHLKAARPAEAAAVLEAELLNAGGSRQFLDLLRAAYTARLRELQDQKADGATVETVRRRLKALADAGPTAPPGPADLAATVRPPAPPIPDAPADLTAPAPVGPAPSIPTATATPSPPPISAGDRDDPFQQPVGDQRASGDHLRGASEAFAARRYTEAAKLFAEAARRQGPLSAAQRDEWAYARMHGVAMALNHGTSPTADLVREVGEAMKTGSEQVAPFGNRLLTEIRRRGPAAGGPTSDTGWEVIETLNFRILHRGQPTIAAEIGQTAEAARKDMYDRWAGTTGTTWAPRCDIHVHSSATDYAKATRKPTESPGHSTVGLTGGRVATRRIDVRLDEPTLIDAVLPSEVTQVVLADLFADQPLPRWAIVGMAALSESPEAVARYRRAVPTLLRDRKLFAVGPFLEQTRFPDAGSITPFYAESVSLVSYLVELRGPKAFATFLREAPRRGYTRALASHYGFKDAADLQDRWQKHVLGGE